MIAWLLSVAVAAPHLELELTGGPATQSVVLPISSFDFGVGFTPSQTAAGRTQTTVGPLVRRPVDAQSELLKTSLLDGAQFDTATVRQYIAHPTQSNTELVSIEVAFRSTFVSDIDLQARAGDELLLEQVTLAYQCYTETVYSYDSTGALVGTDSSSWSLVWNQPRCP